MRENVESAVYISDDKSLPVSDKAFRFPINSFLSQVLHEGDELKVILLIKKDNNSFFEKNTYSFKSEIEDICKKTGSKMEISLIDTDFSEEKENHELLMGKLVDEIEVGAHILVDITYGPKDLPIVIFTALGFAERFLNCEMDNIVYGQALLKDNKVVESRICDMIPLYCLGSVTNTIKCDDPQKAKQMLKSLLSI